jgi:hypothetical protein
LEQRRQLSPGVRRCHRNNVATPRIYPKCATDNSRPVWADANTVSTYVLFENNNSKAIIHHLSATSHLLYLLLYMHNSSSSILICNLFFNPAVPPQFDTTIRIKKNSKHLHLHFFTRLVYTVYLLFKPSTIIVLADDCCLVTI